MSKAITGTAQTALDLTVTIPTLRDVSSSARFEDTIQTTMNNLATLEARISSGGGSATVPSLSITTAKLAPGAVTKDKLGTTNTGVDDQVLSIDGSGLTWVNPPTASVGNLSLSLIHI